MKSSSDSESAPRTAQSLTIALSEEDLDALSKISDFTHTHPSTLAYQCFKTGLTSLLDSLRQPWQPAPPNSPLQPDPPKRNAKYVTIYITERDLSHLHNYPRLNARRFPPRSIMRALAAHWMPKLTALAYDCFRKGLALKLHENAADAPAPLTPWTVTPAARHGLLVRRANFRSHFPTAKKKVGQSENVHRTWRRSHLSSAARTKELLFASRSQRRQIKCRSLPFSVRGTNRPSCVHRAHISHCEISLTSELLPLGKPIALPSRFLSHASQTAPTNCDSTAPLPSWDILRSTALCHHRDAASQSNSGHNATSTHATHRHRSSTRRAFSRELRNAIRLHHTRRRAHANARRAFDDVRPSKNISPTESVEQRNPQSSALPPTQKLLSQKSSSRMLANERDLLPIHQKRRNDIVSIWLL